VYSESPWLVAHADHAVHTKKEQIMSAGLTPGGTASRVARRLALVALGGILVACSESPAGPKVEAAYVRPAPVWAPSFAAAVNFNAIDYALAIANANTIIFVIQGSLTRPFGSPGNILQSALLGTPTFGFPTDRDKYLVVSSGDARAIGAEMAYGGCRADLVFGTLCDEGGLDVPVYIYPTATRIEIDVRYWSVDYTPFEDPFKIFVIDGAVTQVFQATITSEFGSKSPGPLLFGPFRKVVINAAPYRGRVITLRFLASDDDDTVVPSGALIDNVKVF